MGDTEGSEMREGQVEAGTRTSDSKGKLSTTGDEVIRNDSPVRRLMN